jgi:hypothetical protein
VKAAEVRLWSVESMWSTVAMTTLFEPVVRFIAGQAPKPLGRALAVADVPDEATLRSATVASREAWLCGLALTHAADPSAPVLSALRNLCASCDAVTLRGVLEAMVRRGSLGFVVETLELEWLLDLGASVGVAVNDVLATSDSVTRRGLTQVEAKRIEQNFGGTLDPATVRLCFTTGVQTMGAGAMVVGNTIHVDPQDPRWQIKRGTTLAQFPNDEAWDSFNGIVLAHEPTHVWSYQHQGSAYAINSVLDQVQALKQGSRNGAYVYQPGRAHFVDYGEEQRAMMVQDYVAAVRGKAAGDTTSLTMYGGTRPNDEVIAALEKYILQMRAVGPGVARPGPPTPILCACVRSFSQDGLAGFLGSEGSALVGAAGRASTQAIIDGLAHHDAGKVALGTAGVAAAVAASVVPREQNDGGGAGGGSAILDQAGVPRGIEIGRDGLAGSVKAAWDAPVAGLGVKDPRLEWAATVHRTTDGTTVDAKVQAVMGKEGDLRRSSGGLRVEGDQASLEVEAGLTPERPAAALSAWAHVELVTEPVSLRVEGALTMRGEVVMSATAGSRVETKGMSVATSAAFSRATRDAPLAFDEAEFSLHGVLPHGVSGALRAHVVPAGLDGLTAELAAQGAAGSLAVAATGTHLTTVPTVGVTVTATEKTSGVAVAARLEATPARGEVEGGVMISIPIPDGARRDG